MKELIPCNCCRALISDTAFLCPMCLTTQDLKDRKIESSIGKAIILGASAVVFNPIAVASVMADTIRGSKAIKEVKNLAKTCCAIDAFYLNDMLVMVTNIDFVFVIGCITIGISGPATIQSIRIPYNRIHEVYIDENRSSSGSFFKSSRTYLCVRNTSGVLVECPSYEFKGKNSRELAEFARAKFMEY